MKSTMNVVDRILTVKVTIKSLFSNSLVRDEIRRLQLGDFDVWLHTINSFLN